MAYVTLDPNDDWMEDHGVEKMIRKFKKKVDTEGILKDLRKREFYMAPSLKRRMKSKEAERRRRITEAKKTKFYNVNEED